MAEGQAAQEVEGEGATPKSSRREIKVFVNLEENRVTIMKIEREKIFDGCPPLKRFIIEGDGIGFSAIEKREDGYHDINVLRGEIIRDRVISANEAKRIIREVIREREGF
jgi:KaiC/GvpD/RAD55 family RecA-like ATPase